MSCGINSDAERHAALVAAHGQPVLFPDTGAALWLLNARHKVHPRDAVAWVYRDQAAADAYAESNAAHFGVPSLGSVPHYGGVLAVLSLAPVLEAHGCPVTDPVLPDGWRA
jgi:hypothetical protein